MSDSDIKAGDKIKVVCHGCGARYRVSSEKVKGRRFRATCKRCGGIIVARCTSAFTVLPDEGHLTGSITEEKSEVILRDGLEQAWYAVIDQKPHGPLSGEQLQQYFSAGHVSGRTYLWRSGDPEWRRLQDVPEFSALVAEEPTTAYSLDSARAAAGSSVAWPDRDSGDDDEVDGDPTSADTRVLDTGIPLNTDEAFGEGTPTDEPTNYRYRAPLSQAAPVPYDPNQASGSNLPSKPTLMGWDAPEFLQDEPRAPAPQPAPTVPRMQPRKAWLPAPTGIPRHLTGGLHQTVDRGDMADPGPLFTRPLPRDRAMDTLDPDLNPPTLETDESAVSLSSLAPMRAQVSESEIPLITPGPILELPSQGGRSETARVSPAAAQLPPPSPALADAHKITRGKSGGFWTTGKIAVAAAVGGGMVVALAVIFGVYLARSGTGRVATPEEALAMAKVNTAAATTQVAATTTARKKPAPPKPRAAPAPEKIVAAPKPAEEKAPVKEPPVADEGDEPGAPIKAVPAAPAAQEAKPAGTTAVAAKPKSRPRKGRSSSRRKKSSPRRRRSSSADVDALLLGSTPSRPRRRPTSGRAAASDSNADDILAAGTTRRRRPSSGRAAASDSSADDILAAGTTRRRRAASRPAQPNLPKHPTKDQVQGTMRRAMPRVASCYEKYQQRGIIKVSMRVRPDGSADGRVVGSFAGTATAFCVLAGVNKLRFPRFSGAAFSFVYPYRLK